MVRVRSEHEQAYYMAGLEGQKVLHLWETVTPQRKVKDLGD